MKISTLQLLGGVRRHTQSSLLEDRFDCRGGVGGLRHQKGALWREDLTVRWKKGGRVCGEFCAMVSRRCNDRGGHRWELAWVSQRVGGDSFFTFGSKVEEGLRCFYILQNDVVLIL